MLPAKALIVVCPHCGGEKELLNLISGNTIGAEMWSDKKYNAPMMPRVSPIQKCPQCGHFFQAAKCESKQGDSYSFETGWPTFSESLEMLKEAETWPVSDREKVDMNVIAIWAYNDIIRNGHTPTAKDTEAFTAIVRDTLPLIIGGSLFAAELHREIEEYDKCLQIIEQLNQMYASTQQTDSSSNDNSILLRKLKFEYEYNPTVAEGMAERARNKDAKVWQLY